MNFRAFRHQVSKINAIKSKDGLPSRKGLRVMAVEHLKYFRHPHFFFKHLAQVLTPIIQVPRKYHRTSRAHVFLNSLDDQVRLVLSLELKKSKMGAKGMKRRKGLRKTDLHVKKSPGFKPGFMKHDIF